MTSSECSKCRSTDLRRSRIRNVVEWVVAPLIVAYRCKLCDWREFKFRMIITEPQPRARHREDDAEPEVKTEPGVKADPGVKSEPE